ncbi:hypothetical protein PI125_g5520 [Phytophthora idaei]|nr:hypothetical protein PI125_g5520 [Phytophthora idaei]
MILDAREVPSTQKVAVGLLDSLTLRWMYNREPPASVYQWLRVQQGTTAIRKIYDNYDQLYKMKYPAW